MIGVGGDHMKSDTYQNGASEQQESQENDFIDLMVAATVSTVVLMGIFLVFTIVDLLI